MKIRTVFVAAVLVFGTSCSSQTIETGFETDNSVGLSAMGQMFTAQSGFAMLNDVSFGLRAPASSLEVTPALDDLFADIMAWNSATSPPTGPTVPTAASGTARSSYRDRTEHNSATSGLTSTEGSMYVAPMTEFGGWSDNDDSSSQTEPVSGDSETGPVSGDSYVDATVDEPSQTLSAEETGSGTEPTDGEEVGSEEVDGTSAADPLAAPTVVPEPVTMILLGSGLIGVAGAARRRRSRET